MDLLKYLGNNKKHLPSMLWFLRLANLAIVFALIYFGWGVVNEEQRWTNFTSWLVWTIWWPFIVFEVLFTARLWCGMCHLKLIVDTIDKYGLHLKVPEKIKKFGPTMGIGMFIVFLLHSSVVSYGVDSFGHLTAVYLILLMVFTALIALTFERHVFCRYFCPLIGFLSNYTRCCPTELRSTSPEKCRTCKAKECIKHCPHKLYMGNMDSYQQEACMLCMQCVKHCPNDNISFRTRKFFKGIYDSRKRSSAAAIAVIVLLGIVIGEFGEKWAPMDNFSLTIPSILAEFTGVEKIFPVDFGAKDYNEGYRIFEAIWLFFLQPFIIIGICGLIAWAWIRKRKEKIWDIIKIYAIGFLPLLFVLHLARQFGMTNSHLFYLPYIIGDLNGEKTASAIASGTLAKPSAILSNNWEGWLFITLILIGVIASLYVLWKISKANFEDTPEEGKISVIPFMICVIILGVVFSFAVYNWLIVGV